MRTQYKKTPRCGPRRSTILVRFYRSAACCSSTSAKWRGASSTINTAGQTGMPVERAAMYAVGVKAGAGQPVAG